MNTVACPTCKTQIVWDPANPYRPFCCERCKLIDLGAWADGTYTIPVESNDPEEYIGEDNHESD